MNDRLDISHGRAHLTVVGSGKTIIAIAALIVAGLLAFKETAQGPWTTAHLLLMVAIVLSALFLLHRQRIWPFGAQ